MIIINELPNNINDKNRLYYDLTIYYELKNIEILYKIILFLKTN